MTTNPILPTGSSGPRLGDSPVPEIIDELWEHRAELTAADHAPRESVLEALDLLDSGAATVAAVDPATDEVVVDERARRAILLSFRLFEVEESGVGPFRYRDRLPLKRRFDGVRVVPGAIARFGSHVARGAVLMPSFVNVGAHVGPGSMIDTWATVGSCAQVGANVHLSGGAGLGGVLEPVGAVPVVVEDDAFIGSRSMIVEGARVERGAKLGAGVLLTGNTRVFDAESGQELPQGRAPSRSLCVGSMRMRTFPGGEFGTPCLLVVRWLREGETLDKLRLDSLFREHGGAS
ncbi:2,3,4,5-tetrahydropyridine-2,6-dicarboxylate N-succinyltransferase [Streptomyces capitiformicae]|uniref:2,3,4,5-tetrahydropyridine-2,6-dicarboxylate N-succinyltransferase n=1 Tax=Streptomyces capitiformicae TaxID=2014920 RepID=A0A919DCZ0_9ACTN|nr:2,3,4,5-tetrahydropyridine-2,6-dicarboxylate N-succinyltransferase [Streptomyces capitiformicae]GHE34725.1 2,3,4,5-tetrahydropyridine-2,6-dicarboxylate N-succinyltransferase [Streptomyces capitiformicae]